MSPSQGVRSPATPGLFNCSRSPASFHNNSLNSPGGITSRLGGPFKPTLPSPSQNSHLGQVPQRTLGRNLLGSFSPDPPQSNRLPLNSVSNKPKSFSNNYKNSSVSEMNSTNFHFNPVIAQPNKFNLSGFAQTNSERNSIQVPSQNRLIEIKTQSPRGGNATVVLSQSSQLTAEEQLAVESVFDGIDADSLFDDDDF